MFIIFYVLKNVKKNNDTTLRLFYQIKVFQFLILLNNFAKRNLKPNNQMIMNELKESHLGIMNLNFQSDLLFTIGKFN